MCIFVFFVTIYMLFLISLFFPYNTIAGIVSYISISINLLLFFKTMFGDPGINPQIYMHYIKMQFSPKYDIGLEDGDEDLENGGNESVTQRGAKKALDKKEDMMV